MQKLHSEISGLYFFYGRLKDCSNSISKLSNEEDLVHKPLYGKKMKQYAVVSTEKDEILANFCSFDCLLNFHERMVWMIKSSLQKKGFRVFHKIEPKEIRVMRIVGDLKRECNKYDSDREKYLSEINNKYKSL
jgi:hypothetical protein